MKFEWIVMFTIIHHSLTQLSSFNEDAVDFPDNCTGYINGTDLTCKKYETECTLLVHINNLI
jgi:hypothetical protein